jgi:hypothetical protein
METYKRYIYYLGSTITPFNIDQLLGCVAPRWRLVAPTGKFFSRQELTRWSARRSQGLFDKSAGAAAPL